MQEIMMLYTYIFIIAEYVQIIASYIEIFKEKTEEKIFLVYITCAISFSIINSMIIFDNFDNVIIALLCVAAIVLYLVGIALFLGKRKSSKKIKLTK